MKPHSAYRLVRKGSRNLAIALVSLLAANAAQSATLYWDTNGAGTAGSGAATGTWGTSNFWNSDSTGGAGGSFITATTNADNLFIAAGTGTTGTITVSGTQAANSITLDDNVAITLSGGTGINLGSTSGAGIFVASGDNAANTISTAITLGANSTIQTAGSGVLTLSGGVLGTGNVILNDNSTNANGITISGYALNNAGTITNSGTSTGGVIISGGVGSNVTSINQNSTTSALTISTTALTVNSGGTTLTNTLGTKVLTVSGGVTGTGNLILNNNSATNSGITLSTTTINNTGTITNSGTSTGNVLISANIGAAVTGLTQSSATSTLILSGANTYTGATLISAGTLQIGNAGTTGSLSPSSSITNNGTLTFNRTNTLTQGIDFASSISTTGTGNLTQAGSGTVILNGTNSYGGVTTVSAGTLQFAKETALYNNVTGSWTATNIIVASGATAAFNVGGTGEFTASDIQTLSGLGTTTTNGFANGSKLALDTTNAGGSFTYGNVIANPNSGSNGLALTKLGTGSLILSNANSYTGATLISAGTLQLGNGSTTGALSTSSAITNNATLAFNRTDTVTQGTNFSTAAISGSGNVIQNGSGILVLNVANTFTGGVILNAGQITVGNAGALGTTGTFTINGGTLDTTGAITISTKPVTLNADFAFTGTNTLSLGVGAYSLGTAAGTTRTITANASTLTLGGIISNGTTANSLTKAGSGNLVLSAANLYTGTTTVNAGILQAGNATAFGPVTTATLAFGASSTGKIQLNGQNMTVVGLNTNATVGTPILESGSGTVGTDTLTVNNGTANTFAGVLQNGSTRLLALTKTGAGTLTLSGANTHTGGTNVNGGTLLWSGANNLPATGTLAVGAGGTFSLADGTAQGTSTAALSLAAGANLSFDWNGSAVDTLTSTGAATTVAGNVGIVLNPANSPGGTGLTLVSAPSGLGTATYFLANNTNYTATLSKSATALTINDGSYATATALTSAYWLGNQVTGALGSMSLSSGTTSNWAAAAGDTTATALGVVPGASTNVFFSTTSGATQQGSITLDSDMTVNSLTFNDATAVTIGAAPAHALTLRATTDNGNTDGNGITVSSTANATTAIGANILLGGNQTWTVASGKALNLNGTLAGTNNLTIVGPGTIKLAGANTLYTGTTTINSGILQAGSTTAFGPATSAKLAFGSGSTGKVQLNGANSMTVIGLSTDATTPGTPILENGAAGTATLTVNNATNYTFAGTLQNGAAGTLALIKSGAADLTLSGTNTYTGATAISGGTLSFGAAVNLPTNATNITFNNGGRLVYTGTASVGNYTFTGGNDNQYIVVSNAAGNVNAVRSASNYNGLWKDGPGTLTYTANYQDSGGMVIVGGTAIVSNTSNRADYYSASNNMEVRSGATLKVGNNGIGIVYYDGGFSMDNGTFDVNGINPTADQNHCVPAISGSGTITNSVASTTGTALIKIGSNKTFSGNIVDGASGTGKVAVNLNQGGSIWTLSGNNTYTGATTIANGIMQAGSTTAFSQNSAYSVASGKTLDLNGYNNSIGSLTNAGNVTLGSATLTLGNDNTSPAAFSGTISGPGSVIKTGTGNFTLSGANNSYSGGLSINNGTVTMSGTGKLEASTGALTLGGGVLDLGTTTQTIGAVSITAPAASGDTIKNGSLIGASYAASNITGTATVSANLLAYGSAGLTKTGAGTLTLSGAGNTYTGGTSVNAGSLVISGSGKLGATTGALTLGGGTLDLGATSQTQGAVSITAAAASGNTIQNGSLSGTSYAASNSTGNAIVTANLLVNGSAGLTKSGAGTLTLSGTGNTYSGGNIVNNGTLAVTTGSTLGATTNALTLGGGVLDLGTTSQTAGAVSLTVAAASGDTLKNGSLTGTSYAVSNSSGNAIISANLLVNGAAGLAMSGAGTLTLSGANTYSGGTSISNGGTVVMSGSGTLGSTSSSLAVNSATLDLNGTSQQVDALTGTAGTLLNNATGTASTLTVASGTYDGAIANHTSGTGTLALTKTTSGTLTLSNTSTYTGATTINGGKLVLTGYLGDTAIAVNPGATFAANSASGGTLYAGNSTTSGTSSMTLHDGDFTMVNNAIGTFRLGSGGLTTITSTVLPMLSFDIGNSAGSIDLLDLGTMGGNATIAAGTLLDFSALSGATGLATGDYTFLTTSSGGLGASAFTLKNSTITVNGHGYTFSLANSTSTQQVLTVANAITTIGTTYTLAATASAPKIHVGGSSTVTATITNTGLSSSYADTLDYTNLTVSNAAQLNGTWPKAANASPIANDDGTDTHSGSITGLTSAGAYTFTPTVASATNHTIGNGSGVPVLTGTTPVTVDVYALASPDTVSGSIGNYHVGVAKALSLTNGTAGTHNEDLNAGITAGTNTTVSGSVTGLLAGATNNNHLWVTLGGGAGSQTGEVTVDLTSAGTVAGISNTLGTTSLTSQTLAVSGTGYYLATAASTQTVNIGAIHVGGTGSAPVTLTNTAPVDATYTETLGSNGFSSPSSGITTSGSVSGIVGGGSGSGTLTVGFDNSWTVGAGKSGTTTLALNSTAVNGSGLGTTSVGSQTLTVTGDVFDGSGKWTLASGTSGSWGTHANWIDANGATGAPGTFAGFDNVDTATFDGTGSTATINLDSAAPSLKALTFSGATNYTIGEGSGSNKLTLKIATGTATVTVGGSHAITAPVTLASNSTFGTALVSDALTISGNVDGAGTLTKTGIGTLTLSGTANTYGGETYINGGTLVAASLPNNNTIAFNNSGKLEFTGTTGVARLDTGSASGFDIKVTTGNLSVSRNGGNYNVITKSGGGTLTVANTYWDDGGSVSVNEGTVVLAGGTNVGAVFANVDAIQDVKSGATVKLGNANAGQVWYGSSFTMTGGTFDVNGINGALMPVIAGSGFITNSVAATTGTGTFRVSGAKAFSGNIVDGAGAGKMAINLQDGGGTWTLSGANTNSGATLVNGANLTAASTTALSPNSAYTVGATLDLAGYSNQIAGLTGGGTVRSTGGAAVLTVNNDVLTSNADYTFSGVLQNGTGTLGLTKTGTKILTLSGTNTYTGVTNVSQGTLKLALGSSTNNISSSSSIHIASGAALDVSGLSGTQLALASGQVLMGNGSVTGGSVALGTGVIEPGDRTLVTPAKGTLTIANALDLTGGTTNIRLFSDTANDSDKLVQSTAGTITFGGTLNLTEAGNFTGTFAAGNSWDLFDWTGTPTTTFTTVNLPTLSGLTWDTTSLYTSGVVSIASIGAPIPQLVITTPANTRVLANAGKTIDGTYGNSGTASLTATLTDNGGALTVASFSPSGSQIVSAGTIDQPFTGSISDVGPVGTGKTFHVAFGSATASGTLDVVDQRSFSVGTPTIALGMIHAGTVSTGTTAISSAGESAVTANASLGSFAGTNTGSLTLTTSDSTAFNGATTQTANYSLGGSIAAGVLGSASFSSTVSAELGSISPVVVNVTGSATNGLATWTAAGNGNWSANGDWTDTVGINAAPGTFAGFGGVDTATFDAGGHTVTVDTPVNLNALSFTGASNYTLATGAGSLRLAGDSPGITVAGTQLISAPITLAQSVAVMVTGSGDSLTLSGDINSGLFNYSLAKNGAGTLTLSGDNTYHAGTVVSGTLLVNNTTGSGTGDGPVNVNTGSTLGGTGRIGGAVNVSGTLSPGSPVIQIQSLACGGNLDLANGSHFAYQAQDGTSSGADLMVVAGSLSLTAVTLDLTGLDALTWTTGSKLTLLSYTGNITSGFVNASSAAYLDNTSYLFGTNAWIFDYNAPSTAANKGSNFASEIPTIDTVPNTALVTVTLDAYKTWAAQNGLSGTPAAFTADSNNDGVSNGMAWVLGATNPNANNNGLLPKPTASASGGLTLTFNRLEASIGVTNLVLQYATSPAGPWTDVPITQTGGTYSGVVVSVNEGNTPDAVSVNIPASKTTTGKLFSRLQAVQP